jgi:hypothetical protein
MNMTDEMIATNKRNLRGLYLNPLVTDSSFAGIHIHGNGSYLSILNVWAFVEVPRMSKNDRRVAFLSRQNHMYGKDWVQMSLFETAEKQSTKLGGTAVRAPSTITYLHLKANSSFLP